MLTDGCGRGQGRELVLVDGVLGEFEAGHAGRAGRSRGRVGEEAAKSKGESGGRARVGAERGESESKE